MQMHVLYKVAREGLPVSCLSVWLAYLPKAVCGLPGGRRVLPSPEGPADPISPQGVWSSKALCALGVWSCPFLLCSPVKYLPRRISIHNTWNNFASSLSLPGPAPPTSRRSRVTSPCHLF